MKSEVVHFSSFTSVWKKKKKINSSMENKLRIKIIWNLCIPQGMKKISKNLASLLMRLWEVKNINKESKRADLSNDLMSSYFIAWDFFF